MTEAEAQAYTGADNLEVMAEAVNYNNYLLDLIARELRPHDRVLDFGTGSGTFIMPLVARGIDVIGVEPDLALRSALQRAQVDVHPNLDAIGAESLDFVYSFNVLEHIEDDRAALRELASKLKNGGRMLIYVPAFPILFSAMDRKVHHFRRYRCRRLAAMMAEAGLDIGDARYADSLGFAATLLYRLIGNDSGEINRSALKLYDRFAFPLSRALDRVVSRWIGKNLVIHATKNERSPIAR